MAEEIKVENVVASASLNVKVPLNQLVAQLPGTEYEPEQFPGLVYRMQDPKAAALIFSSGKIVCTGATSSESAKEAIDKVVEGIRSIGVDVERAFDIEIQNIVASTKLESTLNLNEIAFSLRNTEYEPEQFPGLVYRIEDPKVAFLLFGSGKVVCTGGRSIEEVERAVSKIEEELGEIGAITD
ncbi:MAG: TATA-box-binding protein [Candidatus Aenigmatarchaeota archaeon]